MRRPTFFFFLIAVLCAGLFAGCEWTGSDSESSWSGSYDDMNFSGTYRVAASSEPSGGEQAKVPSSEIVSGDQSGDGSRDSYAGRVHANVVPNSFNLRAGNDTYSDDGEGGLVGQSGGGTIKYSSGAWEFRGDNAVPANEPIRVNYSYFADIATAEEITSLTVSQTGQNLTIILSNGVTMSGKFTTVNESGGGEGGTAYNAGFEVSSSGNKLVGTLNSASGKRVISGTWLSGKTHYGINGTAN